VGNFVFRGVTIACIGLTVIASMWYQTTVCVNWGSQ